MTHHRQDYLREALEKRSPQDLRRFVHRGIEPLQSGAPSEHTHVYVTEQKVENQNRHGAGQRQLLHAKGKVEGDDVADAEDDARQDGGHQGNEAERIAADGAHPLHQVGEHNRQNTADRRRD